MHTDWSRLSLWFFQLWWFWLTFNKNPPIHLKNLNMMTCQSANQLKTPAKVSWAFKMVSQFGSLGYTIMGRLLIWQLSRRQSLTPFTRRVSHKHSLPKKLAVHRVLYPSMLTESWEEGKVWKKKMHNQPREHSLMRIVKQNRFNNLAELHKE